MDVRGTALLGYCNDAAETGSIRESLGKQLAGGFAGCVDPHRERWKRYKRYKS